MSSTFDFVMVEHPAWQPLDGGCRRVFTLPDGGRYLYTVRARELATHLLASGSREPTRDAFTMSNGLLGEVPELATALVGLGSVLRFRNVDLWDAISTAILRQVIRAGQSKKLYRAFSGTYGEQVKLPDGGTYALFPTPETVMNLESEQFSSIGMAFNRRPLMAAAEAYLEHGAKWRELSPHALIDELQIVPRIGPWTAHAAVTDWSNDWTLYPYADLAVRTWAMRAAPSYEWPTDEAAFGRVWRTLAGDHLSALTLLTLAWGSQHGDIG
jgi:DNA-3-methyladenine glycosylase II